MCIRIKVVGYAKTAIPFAREFLKIFRECTNPGTFSTDMIENVI